MRVLSQVFFGIESAIFKASFKIKLVVRVTECKTKLQNTNWLTQDISNPKKFD